VCLVDAFPLYLEFAVAFVRALFLWNVFSISHLFSIVFSISHLFSIYIVLSLFLTVLSLSACALSPSLSPSLSPDQAKLEQAKLAAKVMNVATPGTSVGCSGADCAGAELKNSAVQAELKTMQKGLGIFFYCFLHSGALKSMQTGLGIR
jgi:hypothetical protein